MNFRLTAIAISFLISSSALAQADEMICALNTAKECTVEGDCRTVTPAAINLPAFIKVDTEKKKMTSGVPEDPREEDIEGIQPIEGGLLMHGVQDEEPWASVYLKKDHSLTGTIVSGGTAFVVFGHCVPD